MQIRKSTCSLQIAIYLAHHANNTPTINGSAVAVINPHNAILDNATIQGARRSPKFLALTEKRTVHQIHLPSELT